MNGSVSQKHASPSATLLAPQPETPLRPPRRDPRYSSLGLNHEVLIWKQDLFGCICMHTYAFSRNLMGNSYFLQDKSYLVQHLEWKNTWNALVIVTQPWQIIRKAQDITVQRELKFIFQIIHRGVVNLLKILKRSENFYTIMEIKSLDKNLIPSDVASKYPVLLRLFFFRIETSG